MQPAILIGCILLASVYFVTCAPAEDTDSSTKALNQEVSSTTATTPITSTTLSTTAETTVSSSTSDNTTNATIPSDTPTATNRTARKYLTTDGLPTCKQNNANFNGCVKKIFEVALTRLKDGDPELNIPSIDPFKLNRTAFRYQNGPISGRILMRNALVHGFSKLKFKDFEMKVNESENSVRAVSYVSEVHIVGDYKAELVINNVRLRPRGDFDIAMFNLTIEQSSEGNFYERDGHRFVRLNKFDAVPKVGDFKFQATGLFPDPTLNEIANNIINQYWRQIFQVFLPETRQYWAPMLLHIINEAMSAVPYDLFVN